MFNNDYIVIHVNYLNKIFPAHLVFDEYCQAGALPDVALVGGRLGDRHLHVRG